MLNDATTKCAFLIALTGAALDAWARATATISDHLYIPCASAV